MITWLCCCSLLSKLAQPASEGSGLDSGAAVASVGQLEVDQPRVRADSDAGVIRTPPAVRLLSQARLSWQSATWFGLRCDKLQGRSAGELVRRCASGTLC